MMRTRIVLLISVVISAFTVGCEDPVPTDYVQELVVEGFVFVGQPIENIRIMKTLPIADTFRLIDAAIRDAQVRITVNGVPLAVEYVPDSLGGTYRVADREYRAVSGATYNIEVVAIGKKLTATTLTPDTLSWVQAPKDTLQYPGRLFELTRSDSLDVSWTPVNGVSQYIVAVECIDTLGYGIYLNPQTTDTNRRIRDQDRFDSGTLIASERVRFGFSILTRSPTVWSVFKWFGKHEIRVYAGDQAFQEWFRMVGFGRRSSYDYRLSNIKGGLGTWGSASSVSKSAFLKKDQIK
jgi:hypothetical protein